METAQYDSALCEAVTHLRDGKADQALSRLTSLIELNTPIRHLHTLLAIAFSMNQQNNVVLESLKHELALFPDNEQALNILRALTGGDGQRVTESVLQMFAAVEHTSQDNPLKGTPARNSTATTALQQTAKTPDAELAHFFPDTVFGGSVQVIGVNNILIGSGCVIGDDVWLNVCVRDQHKRMSIGNCTLIGRQSMISTGGRLEIGAYCVFAPRVYVSDADHGFSDISQPILQQQPTLGRSLTIEENCWLGVNVVVSGALTLGRGSVVGASSVLLRDVPPFCVVVGNPARIVKMYNPQSECWERVESELDQQRMLAIRETHPIPSRSDYRKILQEHAAIRAVDPIVAGRSVHI